MNRLVLARFHDPCIRVVVVLAMVCALNCCTRVTGFAELPAPGMVRYHSFPIASHAEQVQARRIGPSRADRCRIYVVSDRDFWSSSAGRRVNVVLLSAGGGMPPLPASPSDLATVFGGRVRGILDEVYAMWEVPPGNYRLCVLSVEGYGDIYFRNATGKRQSRYLVTRDLFCQAGAVLFLAVGDRGYFGFPEIRDPEPAVARQRIKNGLLSAGVFNGASGYGDGAARGVPPAPDRGR